MPSVCFYLKDKNSESKTPIYARYQSKYLGNFKFYPGILTHPKDWDFKKQKAKSSHRLSTKVNKLLNLVEDAIEGYMIDCSIEGKRPHRDELMTILDNLFRYQDTRQSHSVVEFINDEIGKRSKSPEYTAGTIRKYKSTLSALKEFRPKLSFHQVDMTFFNSWVAYLNEKDFSPNTIHKHISILKVFMAVALEEGKTTNDKWKSKRFTVSTVKAVHVVLDVDELSMLQKIELDDRLRKVRDMFLIGAWTGLRWGDYSSLKPSNFFTQDGRRFLKIKTQKTGEIVIIPIHPVVLEILERYGWKSPKTITNQKANEYLKEIAQLAGIDKPVESRSWDMGKEVIELVPKWSRISTHTARRSFATNMVLAGIHSRKIMALTGHKTESAFNAYVYMDKLKGAIDLAGEDFFK